MVKSGLDWNKQNGWFVKNENSQKTLSKFINENANSTIPDKNIQTDLCFSNPLKSIEITSPFGYRIDAIPNVHNGVDFKAATGTEVYASEAGKIIMALIEAPSDISNSNSSVLKISHGNGWESRYLHMDSFVVKQNDVVLKTQLIGYTGSRKKTQPHLHFEIRKNNIPQNPELIINKSIKNEF